jgi:hypothetical protein
MKQTLTKLNSRERVILTVCMIMVLIFLWMKFVFKPLKEKEDAIDSRMELSEGKIRKNLKILAQAGKTGGDRERYSIEGSPKDFLEKTVAEIKRMATAQDLKLSDIEPADPIQEGIMTKIFINVRLQGKLTGLLKFAHHMEGAPYYLEPNEVFIQPDAGDTLQMNITFRKIGLKAPSK